MLAIKTIMTDNDAKYMMQYALLKTLSSICIAWPFATDLMNLRESLYCPEPQGFFLFFKQEIRTQDF